MGWTARQLAEEKGETILRAHKSVAALAKQYGTTPEVTQEALYLARQIRMAEQVAEYMLLENQLHHAVDANQFFLLYQPIADLKTGKIICTEALLRWNHPEKGIIGPDHYLNIIEDSGLIRPITQWVLIEACNQYIEYKNAGFPEVRMSVNLSGVLLKNDSLLDMVINALEQTKIDPNGLTMEITEDTLLEDLQSSEKALVAPLEGSN